MIIVGELLRSDVEGLKKRRASQGVLRFVRSLLVVEFVAGKTFRFWS